MVHAGNAKRLLAFRASLCTRIFLVFSTNVLAALGTLIKFVAFLAITRGAIKTTITAISTKDVHSFDAIRTGADQNGTRARHQFAASCAAYFVSISFAV